MAKNLAVKVNVQRSGYEQQSRHVETTNPSAQLPSVLSSLSWRDNLIDATAHAMGGALRAIVDPGIHGDQRRRGEFLKLAQASLPAGSEYERTKREGESAEEAFLRKYEEPARTAVQRALAGVRRPSRSDPAAWELYERRVDRAIGAHIAQLEREVRETVADSSRGRELAARVVELRSQARDLEILRRLTQLRNPDPIQRRLQREAVTRLIESGMTDSRIPRWLQLAAYRLGKKPQLSGEVGGIGRDSPETEALAKEVSTEFSSYGEQTEQLHRGTSHSLDLLGRTGSLLGELSGTYVRYGRQLEFRPLFWRNNISESLLERVVRRADTYYATHHQRYPLLDGFFRRARQQLWEQKTGRKKRRSSHLLIKLGLSILEAIVKRILGRFIHEIRVIMHDLRVLVEKIPRIKQAIGRLQERYARVTHLGSRVTGSISKWIGELRAGFREVSGLIDQYAVRMDLADIGFWRAMGRIFGHTVNGFEYITKFGVDLTKAGFRGALWGLAADLASGGLFHLQITPIAWTLFFANTAFQLIKTFPADIMFRVVKGRFGQEYISPTKGWVNDAINSDRLHAAREWGSFGRGFQNIAEMTRNGFVHLGLTFMKRSAAYTAFNFDNWTQRRSLPEHWYRFRQNFDEAARYHVRGATAIEARLNPAQTEIRTPTGQNFREFVDSLKKPLGPADRVPQDAFAEWLQRPARSEDAALYHGTLPQGEVVRNEQIVEQNLRELRGEDVARYHDILARAGGNEPIPDSIREGANVYRREGEAGFDRWKREPVAGRNVRGIGKQFELQNGHIAMHDLASHPVFQLANGAHNILSADYPNEAARDAAFQKWCQTVEDGQTLPNGQRLIELHDNAPFSAREAWAHAGDGVGKPIVVIGADGSQHLIRPGFFERVIGSGAGKGIAGRAIGPLSGVAMNALNIVTIAYLINPSWVLPSVGAYLAFKGIQQVSSAFIDTQVAKLTEAFNTKFAGFIKNIELSKEFLKGGLAFTAFAEESAHYGGPIPAAWEGLKQTGQGIGQIGEGFSDIRNGDSLFTVLSTFGNGLGNLALGVGNLIGVGMGSAVIFSVGESLGGLFGLEAGLTNPVGWGLLVGYWVADTLTGGWLSDKLTSWIAPTIAWTYENALSLVGGNAIEAGFITGGALIGAGIGGVAVATFFAGLASGLILTAVLAPIFAVVGFVVGSIIGGIIGAGVGWLVYQVGSWFGWIANAASGIINTLLGILSSVVLFSFGLGFLLLFKKSSFSSVLLSVFMMVFSLIPLLAALGLTLPVFEYNGSGQNGGSAGAGSITTGCFLSNPNALCTQGNQDCLMNGTCGGPDQTHPLEMAVDVGGGGSDLQVYAPSDGTLVTDPGDPKNPNIPTNPCGTHIDFDPAPAGGTGLSDIIFVFWHTYPLTPLSKGEQRPVKKGDHIGTLYNGAQADCWTGPHVHFFIAYYDVSAQTYHEDKSGVPCPAYNALVVLAANKCLTISSSVSLCAPNKDLSQHTGCNSTPANGDSVTVSGDTESINGGKSQQIQTISGNLLQGIKNISLKTNVPAALLAAMLEYGSVDQGGASAYNSDFNPDGSDAGGIYDQISYGTLWLAGVQNSTAMQGPMQLLNYYISDKSLENNLAPGVCLGHTIPDPNGTGINGGLKVSESMYAFGLIVKTYINSNGQKGAPGDTFAQCGDELLGLSDASITGAIQEYYCRGNQVKYPSCGLDNAQSVLALYHYFSTKYQWGQ